MARLNRAYIKGYLTRPPKVLNENTPLESVLLTVMTVRRHSKFAVDEPIENIIPVMCHDNCAIRAKKYEAYDVVDVKGAITIIPTSKLIECPLCGFKAKKSNVLNTYVYAIDIKKIGSYKNAVEADGDTLIARQALLEQYEETSNEVYFTGTVVSEVKKISEEKEIYRYCIGIDRAYRIPSQPNIKSDYPWIYSFGEQGKKDQRHLVPKSSLIQVDGYMRMKNIMQKFTCPNCDEAFAYKSSGPEFIPYSVEYLREYKTDEEIAKEEKQRAKAEAMKKY